MNQPERALRHALKCIYLLRNREKFSVTLVKAFLAAGNLYKTLKQIKDALECFQKGLALSRKHMGNNFTLTLLLRSALESIRCETLPKQRTSKILKKFTPILHQKTKSGFNESFQKKLDFGKSPAKSLERTRLFQEKMISTGRVMSSQRTRTRLSNISENRDFQAVTSAREEKVKIFQDLKSVDKGNGKILEEVNDLKKVCQFKDEVKQTGVKNCRNKERRFDIEHQRMQERLAAIFIQAWWRGACERREFERMKIQRLVLEAEEKAKIAADYALKLKIKAASLSSLRKPGRIERTKLNSAALQIQMYYKSFKARQRFSKIRRMTLAVKSFLVMIINRGRIPVEV
jgi:tetratricopeptide (TPR) repeat protein